MYATSAACVVEGHAECAVVVDLRLIEQLFSRALVFWVVESSANGGEHLLRKKESGMYARLRKVGRFAKFGGAHRHDRSEITVIELFSHIQKCKV